jgi:hypothetical protein
MERIADLPVQNSVSWWGARPCRRRPDDVANPVRAISFCFVTPVPRPRTNCWTAFGTSSGLSAGGRLNATSASESAIYYSRSNSRSVAVRPSLQVTCTGKSSVNSALLIAFTLVEKSACNGKITADMLTVRPSFAIVHIAARATQYAGRTH